MEEESPIVGKLDLAIPAAGLNPGTAADGLTAERYAELLGWPAAAPGKAPAAAGLGPRTSTRVGA